MSIAFSLRRSVSSTGPSYAWMRKLLMRCSISSNCSALRSCTLNMPSNTRRSMSMFSRMKKMTYSMRLMRRSARWCRKNVCRSLCVALMSSWCVKTCSCTRMPHGGFLLRGCSIPRQLAYRMRRQLCRSAKRVSPTGGSVSRLCLRYGRLKKMRRENESAARSPRMICRTLRPMSTRCSVVNTSCSSRVKSYHGSVSRIASPVHDRKYATMKRSSCR